VGQDCSTRPAQIAQAATRKTDAGQTGPNELEPVKTWSRLKSIPQAGRVRI